MARSALLFTCFGTSYAHTRKKTIDAVEACLKAEFPHRAMYSAWTSGRIVARLRAERGEHHDTLKEAFARLEADGVDDLVVATMCLMPGHEMAKVEQAVSDWQRRSGCRARVAAPLLATADDCAAVARIVCEEFADISADEALLLMGHGSVDGPNQVYEWVREALVDQGRSRFFVGTVEGEPSFATVRAAIDACRVQRVHLAPLMIVAGDHATNDLAGDGAGSWQSLLRAQGYETHVHLRGLGEYQGIRSMISVHAHDALPLSAQGRSSRG